MAQRQTKSSDETMRDKFAANEKRSGYKAELEYIPDCGITYYPNEGSLWPYG